MLRIASILLPLLFLVQTVFAVYEPYNCRRRNQVCGPPGLPGRCLTSGGCLCPSPDYGGYDCTLLTAQIVPTPSCNVNCTGRGICYDDGGPTHRCYCDPGFYGDNCQNDRVSVECAVNSMTFRVFPLNFIGDAFVTSIPPSVNASCQLEAAADGNGLTKTLSLEEVRALNPCSPNLSVATNADGTLVFTYEFTVRYSKGYYTGYDEVHTATCTHTINGPLVGAVVNVGIGGAFTGATVTANASVLEFDVTRALDGVSVVKNNIVVSLGDDLNLDITLDRFSRYDSHRVENCGAYNVPLDPPVNPMRIEKQLVEDGCPALNTLDVISGPISKNGNTISIPISTFKFNTAELFFYCSVRVCEKPGDPLCVPSDCPIQYGGPGSGYGRRRREADGGEIIDVRKTIFVVNMAPKPIAPASHQTIVEESCLKSPAFLAITGVFAVLLLVVLIVTIILVTRRLKREKEQTKGKYSDES